MEIILDELVQYTEKKMNLIDYCGLQFSDIADKKLLIVKYNNKNIEKIDLYYIDEFELDYRQFYDQKCDYIIYFFEIEFDFNKLDYIIDNIRNNLLLNVSNKFRKIKIIKKRKNFIEIENNYNFITGEIKSINNIETIYI